MSVSWAFSPMDFSLTHFSNILEVLLPCFQHSRTLKITQYCEGDKLSQIPIFRKDKKCFVIVCSKGP